MRWKKIPRKRENNLEVVLISRQFAESSGKERKGKGKKEAGEG